MDTSGTPTAPLPAIPVLGAGAAPVPGGSKGPPGGRRGAWPALIVFVGLFALMLAFLGLISLMKPGGESAFAVGPRIGVLEIKGVIGDSETTLKNLRHFRKNESVKALVVRIDSPGGAVAPSQEIYSELRKLGEKKKVVVSMGNLAASGGYYIATAAEKILANPGTLTGSIGVISEFPNVEGLSKWAGVRVTTLKAGKLKDAGSPFRSFTPEETAYYQSLLDDVHRQFISDVAKGRNLPIEEVEKLADGRVFTGQQALKLKLVDELGDFQDAVDLAAKLGGIEGEPKLLYPPEEHRLGLFDLLREGGHALAHGVREELSPPVAGPAFLFRLPGATL